LVGDYDTCRLSSGQGDIHAIGVVGEANALLLVGPCARNDDDILFLSLERIDGIHLNSVSGLRLVRHHFPSLKMLRDVLHLSFIEAYDSNGGSSIFAR